MKKENRKKFLEPYKARLDEVKAWEKARVDKLSAEKRELFKIYRNKCEKQGRQQFYKRTDIDRYIREQLKL